MVFGQLKTLLTKPTAGDNKNRVHGNEVEEVKTSRRGSLSPSKKYSPVTSFSDMSELVLSDLETKEMSPPTLKSKAAPVIIKPKTSERSHIHSNLRVEDSEVDSAFAGGGHQLSLDPSRDGDDEEEDIIEYAQFLGLDPIADADLLWIVREAWSAPLPKGWTEHTNAEGFIFYYQEETDISQWVHPLDPMYRAYIVQQKEMRKRAAANGLIRRTTKSVENLTDPNNCTDRSRAMLSESQLAPTVRQVGTPDKVGHLNSLLDPAHQRPSNRLPLNSITGDVLARDRSRSVGQNNNSSNENSGQSNRKPNIDKPLKSGSRPGSVDSWDDLQATANFSEGNTLTKDLAALLRHNNNNDNNNTDQNSRPQSRTNSARNVLAYDVVGSGPNASEACAGARNVSNTGGSLYTLRRPSTSDGSTLSLSEEGHLSRRTIRSEGDVANGGSAQSTARTSRPGSASHNGSRPMTPGSSRRSSIPLIPPRLDLESSPTSNSSSGRTSRRSSLAFPQCDRGPPSFIVPSHVFDQPPPHDTTSSPFFNTPTPQPTPDPLPTSGRTSRKTSLAPPPDSSFIDHHNARKSSTLLAPPDSFLDLPQQDRPSSSRRKSTGSGLVETLPMKPMSSGRRRRLSLNPGDSMRVSPELDSTSPSGGRKSPIDPHREINSCSIAWAG